MGYPAFIGLRYSFSRKRNRFTALVALVSTLGMVVGVASLIVVLSVMNGFAGELRGRILALVPHGYLEFTDPAAAAGWEALAAGVAADPAVLGVAPYVREKALLGAGRGQRGVQLTGIDPARERNVSRMPSTLVAGRLGALEEAPFRVVLGATLARMLGVGIGDSVRVTLPRFTATPLGLFPRSRSLEVVGLFRVGAEQDAELAYVSLTTARRLLGGSGAPSGLKLRTADLFAAPAVLERLAATLPAGVRAVPSIAITGQRSGRSSWMSRLRRSRTVSGGFPCVRGRFPRAPISISNAVRTRCCSREGRRRPMRRCRRFSTSGDETTAAKCRVR